MIGVIVSLLYNSNKKLYQHQDLFYNTGFTILGFTSKDVTTLFDNIKTIFGY